MTWPAVDHATERVLVVRQDRPVVGLHRGLVDAIVVAGRDGRGVQLVTPPTSRLTTPLRLALDGDSRWVVHDPPRGHYDGISGEALGWRDGAFEPLDEGPPGPVAAYADAPAPSGRQLWLRIEQHHARPPAAFGLAAEAACRALTGAPPASWGTAEPVSERWRPATLSELALRRAPRPTTVTVVGGGERPAIGTVALAAGPIGAVESTTLAVGYPGSQEPPAAEWLAAFADALAREQPLAALGAFHRAGREDLTWPPRREGGAVPVGVAVGPEGLGEVAVGEALTLPGARRVGTDGRPTVWYELADGWDRLARVAERLHADLPDPRL